MEWTEAAKAQEIAVKVAAAEDTKATVPDVPPHLVKCVRFGLAAARQQKAKAAKDAGAKGAKPGDVPASTKSADELMLTELQTADERAKCGVALLEWYRGIQRANNKAAADKGKAKG